MKNVANVFVSIFYLRQNFQTDGSGKRLNYCIDLCELTLLSTVTSIQTSFCFDDLTETDNYSNAFR